MGGHGLCAGPVEGWKVIRVIVWVVEQLGAQAVSTGRQQMDHGSLVQRQDPGGNARVGNVDLDPKD